MVFEAKVGEGRLLVSTFDLEIDDPVSRQLRRSLLDYATSDKFQPTVEVADADFRALWFENRVMAKLGATASANGGNASAAIDGDPNTHWLTGAASRGVPAVPHPHELTVGFREPVRTTGLVLMNRQNDRNHQGDIRGYTVSASDDTQTWQEIVTGELASTWSPQTIEFTRIVTARYLRLTATSGFGADPSAALAELAVVHAGGRLADDVSESQQFKRVRSTSSDVDEGN
jgi:hypothetical protein